jgi:thymidylate synthase (FAD)
LANTINVLDHGFVTLRNLAGPTRRQVNPGLENSEEWLRHFDADDTDVANSARMSFEGQDQDRTYEVEMKLNKYLMKNKHMTPFESIEVWLEMKLPIFVARQFVRHRTCSINEVSGRYVQLPPEWYIPEVVGGKPANKKQGQEDSLDAETQELAKSIMQDHATVGFQKYLRLLDLGVAPEHARIVLGLGQYTHWLWKQDLRNMMHFLALRDHSHAQIEAQKYGQAITQLLEPHIPGLMALYRELMRQE